MEIDPMKYSQLLHIVRPFVLLSSFVALGLPLFAENPIPTKTKKEKVVLEPDPNSSSIYWASRKLQMRFGLQFQSNDNNCKELFATIPFPRDWPEQKVTILEAELPDFARYKEREIAGGVKQLILEVPALAANQTIDVAVTVEIEKSFIKTPEDPSSLVYPKKTLRDKDIVWSLGDSPYIDTKSRQIRAIAKEIKDQEPENAWKHVEAILDWVRNNIQYRNGALRSTQDALKDKYGDCEEMSGLFVAICRASNIPARCVWIPEHCYPEFYLEDVNGFGHWFPCQAAGDRQFGEMQEYRPILQKGDRFKVPEHNSLQRYVAEFFTCKQRAIGPTAPSVVPIRDLGALQTELAAIKQATEPKESSP
jgi:Transglutaminase-like superfamily